VLGVVTEHPSGRRLQVSHAPLDSHTAAACFLMDLKPKELLAAEITVGLASTKPCLWLRNNGRHELGLLCPDLTTAICAISTMREGIATCLRCKEAFLRHRADKQFCSPRCQNTYLTAKRRKRKGRGRGQPPRHGSLER
jgi:hypothetical protein